MAGVTPARGGYRGLAFSHPLRLKIIAHLMSVREASPNELSGELGEPLGNVSYHVRALLNLGVLRPTREEPRRGAVEHFYVLTTTPRALLDELMTEASEKRSGRRRR